MINIDRILVVAALLGAVLAASIASMTPTQISAQPFPTATSVPTDTPGPEPTLAPLPPTNTPRPSPTPVREDLPAPTGFVIYPKSANSGIVVWTQNSNANVSILYVNGSVADYNSNSAPGKHRVVVPTMSNPGVYLQATNNVYLDEYVSVNGTVTGPYHYGPFVVPSLTPSAPTNVTLTHTSTPGVYVLTWTQTSDANQTVLRVNGVQYLGYAPMAKGTYTKQLPPGPPYDPAKLLHSGDSLVLREWSVDDLGGAIDMGTYGPWILP